MTGAQVKKIRLGLGLEPFAFAQVLGVHPSTLYRWEGSPTELKIDPLQRGILEKLQATLKKRASEGQAVGEAVVKGLLVGGALLGLCLLLNEVFKDAIVPKPGIK